MTENESKKTDKKNNVVLDKLSAFFTGYKNIMLHGEKRDKILSWIVIVLLVIFLGYIASITIAPTAQKSIPASELITQLEANNVSELRISSSDGSVDGSFKEITEDGVINFKTNVPTNSETFTQVYLDSSDVKYTFNKPNAFMSFIGSVFMIIFQVGLICGALVLLFRQGGMGDILPFGDNGVDIDSDIPDTTFDDVAGVPEAIEEMQEIVTFLKSPDRYDEAGAKFPHGVLLQGPAGSGKTLLARALAGEAGVPFISTSGSEFIEMYVGVGAKRVRKLFEAARDNQPAILFIDEIDAIGGKRDSGPQTHDERLQTLNQLLTEMDGFKKNEKIIVIGATNRGDSLDPALLRPGRFDRIVTVDAPAKEGRKEILQHYAQGKPFAVNIDFDKLAAHTYSFSGAQLENVMNQAATLAARRATVEKTSPAITEEDLEEGIARTMSGPAMKSKKMSEKEKRQTAYHEAGHAVVQYLMPECDEVQKISIVSRNIPGTGLAMGYVQSYSEEDSYIVTANKCNDEIAALLAGRCSEKIFCGIESAGASDDLRKASNLAYRMIDEFAFDFDDEDSVLRVGVRDPKTYNFKASEQRLQYIDNRVESILKRQFQVASRVLKSHTYHVEIIVKTLMEQETIDASEIKQIMEMPIEGDYVDDQY